MAQAESKLKLMMRTIWLIVWLIFSIILGQIISWLCGRIPSEGRLTKEIPVNLLVFFTMGASVAMMMRFYRKPNYLKKLRLVAMGVTLLYASIIYFMASETPQAVTFDYMTFSILTYTICFLAVLPFLGASCIFSFSRDTPEVDSIFFATTVMWLSPLISELFIWLRWCIAGVLWEKLNYMTLGGSGFSDVIWQFGFWTLISLIIFHIPIRAWKLFTSK